MCSLLSLPNEVLTLVFKLLPLNCRSQIRLVCRRWNEACNVVSITKRENIVISDIYQRHLNIVFKTITDTKRKALRLAFVSLHVGLNRRFWQNCGTKICALSFTECSFDDHVLIAILNSCPNLTKLSFSASEHNPNKLLFSAFDNLLKKRVVASNVTSFSLTAKNLHLDKAYQSTCLWNLLQQVFSNVTELHLNLSVENEDNSDFSFRSMVPVIIASNPKLKILELNFDERPARQQDENVVDLLANLEELEILCLNGFKNIFSRHRMNGFWHLKNLTMFVGDLRFLDDFSQGDFLCSLLDFFPRLRRMELSHLYKSAVDPIIVKKLLASSLRSLKVFFSYECTSCEKITGIFPPNDTLEDLELSLTDDDESVDIGSLESVFIKYFQNLYTLSLNGLHNETILKEITQYQKRLKSLTIGGKMYKWPSSEYGSFKDYSFRNFSEVEYLIIKCQDISSVEMEILPISFLPKLKYLHIDLEGRLTRSPNFSAGLHDNSNIGYFLSFLSAAEELPDLEFIRISTHYAVPYYYLISQCKKHQRLQYFLIEDYGLPYLRFSTEHFQRFFQMRSSLRIVSYNKQCFVKNVITNKIQSFKVNATHHINKYINFPGANRG